MKQLAILLCAQRSATLARMYWDHSKRPHTNSGVDTNCKSQHPAFLKGHDFCKWICFPRMIITIAARQIHRQLPLPLVRSIDRGWPKRNQEKRGGQSQDCVDPSMNSLPAEHTKALPYCPYKMLKPLIERWQWVSDLICIEFSPCPITAAKTR
jgi:hypothetical protein